MSFHLTQKAKADLKDIARYTQKNWGHEQRNNYLQKIDDAFHDLSKEPDKGRDCDYIRAGYKKYRVGKHFIFYRLTKLHHVEIVRVLHGRMNIKKRLTEN
ncbi:MAG: type II toxin-antitoxin system RelE/ParE family toxin [Planctomycetes bacterium]|nr:type II toxin-antitoxin system RelE/ParE family toxin [Planctomycetota bacterium]